MLRLVKVQQKPLAGVLHYKIEAKIVSESQVRFFGEMHVNGVDHAVDVVKNIPVQVHPNDPAVCFFVTDDGTVTTDHKDPQLYGILAYLHGDEELHLLDHS